MRAIDSAVAQNIADAFTTFITPNTGTCIIGKDDEYASVIADAATTKGWTVKYRDHE